MDSAKPEKDAKSSQEQKIIVKAKVMEESSVDVFKVQQQKFVSQTTMEQCSVEAVTSKKCTTVDSAKLEKDTEHSQEQIETVKAKVTETIPESNVDVDFEAQQQEFVSQTTMELGSVEVKLADVMNRLNSAEGDADVAQAYQNVKMQLIEKDKLVVSKDVEIADLLSQVKNLERQLHDVQSQLQEDRHQFDSTVDCNNSEVLPSSMHHATTLLNKGNVVTEQEQVRVASDDLVESNTSIVKEVSEYIKVGSAISYITYL